MDDRISEFGFSPNKAVALGLNLIFLVNLSRSAWLYFRFLLRRIPFTRLERWQGLPARLRHLGIDCSPPFSRPIIYKL